MGSTCTFIITNRVYLHVHPLHVHYLHLGLHFLHGCDQPLVLATCSPNPSPEVHVGVGQELVLGYEAGGMWGHHSHLVMAESMNLFSGQKLDSLTCQTFHGVGIELGKLLRGESTGQPPCRQQVRASPGVGGAV